MRALRRLFTVVVIVILGSLGARPTHARPPTAPRPANERPAPGPPAGSGPTCWRGEWWEPSPQGECRFSFSLRLEGSGTRTRGTFAWRLLRCPGLEHRVGSTGTEQVTGSSRRGGAELRGISVSDATLLATDLYRLTFEGDVLRGTTRTNEGDWNGQIAGRRTSCR